MIPQHTAHHYRDTLAVKVPLGFLSSFVFFIFKNFQTRFIFIIIRGVGVPTAIKHSMVAVHFDTAPSMKAERISISIFCISLVLCGSIAMDTVLSVNPDNVIFTGELLATNCLGTVFPLRCTLYLWHSDTGALHRKSFCVCARPIRGDITM